MPMTNIATIMTIMFELRYMTFIKINPKYKKTYIEANAIIFLSNLQACHLKNHGLLVCVCVKN